MTLGSGTTRTSASDLGGPNVSPPRAVSVSCRSTQIVKAFRLMSRRRSAASSPQFRARHGAAHRHVDMRGEPPLWLDRREVLHVVAQETSTAGTSCRPA